MSLLLILQSGGTSLSLVVEDGTGKPDADALVDLSVFKSYCEARGYSLTGFGDELIEPAIRRGTTYVSNAMPWRGRRTHGRDQALAWPQAEFYDAEGYLIPDNEIPVEVKAATCEASYAELRKPGVLSPIYDGGEQIKSKAVGPLRKEYFAPSSMPMRPVLTVIRDVLAPLLRSAGGNALVGTAVRG